MQQGDVFFDGPDKDKRKIFNELKNTLSTSFPTRDVTSSINYDRLLGEIRRSILASPEKWSNRIYYPKTFERVLCVLIDEDNFEIDTGAGSMSSDSMTGYNLDYVVDLTTGDVNYSNSNVKNVTNGITGCQKPTYYQFYATASVLPAMIDDDTGTSSSIVASTVETSTNSMTTAGYTIGSRPGIKK